MKLKANDPNKKRWHNLNILNDFQQHCKDIDVYDMRILLCLFRHGNAKDQTEIGCRRGAKECGISSSTWEARVQKMRKMGLINFEAMNAKKPKKNNAKWRRRYFVCYANMEEIILPTVPPQLLNRTVPH